MRDGEVNNVQQRNDGRLGVRGDVMFLCRQTCEEHKRRSQELEQTCQTRKYMRAVRVSRPPAEKDKPRQARPT